MNATKNYLRHTKIFMNKIIIFETIWKNFLLILVFRNDFKKSDHADNTDILQWQDRFWKLERKLFDPHFQNESTRCVESGSASADDQNGAEHQVGKLFRLSIQPAQSAHKCQQLGDHQLDRGHPEQQSTGFSVPQESTVLHVSKIYHWQATCVKTAFQQHQQRLNHQTYDQQNFERRYWEYRKQHQQKFE